MQRQFWWWPEIIGGVVGLILGVFLGFIKTALVIIIFLLLFR